MAFGAFAPLPLRLGGADKEGLVAQQHARLCADLQAVKRVIPIVVMTYNKNGATITIEEYHAAEGNGVLHVPPSVVNVGTGQVTFGWNKNFTDAYNIVHPIVFRHAIATVHESVALIANVNIATASSVTVTTRGASGTLTDKRATLRLW